MGVKGPHHDKVMARGSCVKCSTHLINSSVLTYKQVFIYLFICLQRAFSHAWEKLTFVGNICEYTMVFGSSILWALPWTPQMFSNCGLTFQVRVQSEDAFYGFLSNHTIHFQMCSLLNLDTISIWFLFLATTCVVEIYTGLRSSQ